MVLCPKLDYLFIKGALEVKLICMPYRYENRQSSCPAISMDCVRLCQSVELKSGLMLLRYSLCMVVVELKLWWFQNYSLLKSSKIVHGNFKRLLSTASISTWIARVDKFWFQWNWWFNRDDQLRRAASDVSFAVYSCVPSDLRAKSTKLDVLTVQFDLLSKPVDPKCLFELSKIVPQK